jgi:hypothetical protein
MAGRTVRLSFVACCWLLGGCAGTQLKYNTLDVASTLTDIHTKQVLENLSRVIDEPYAIPSQIDIQSGTIGTTNSVTPSLTAPLSSSATRNGSDAITSLTTAGFGLSVNANDSWNQSWQVIPVSDPVSLSNINALFRYVIYGEEHSLKLPPAARAIEPRHIYWSGIASDGKPNPPPPSTEVKDLGLFGNHELYISRSDFNKGYLSTLVLLVQPPAAPDGGASGKGGKKGTPIKRRLVGEHEPAFIGSVRPYVKKPEIVVTPPAAR